MLHQLTQERMIKMTSSCTLSSLDAYMGHSNIPTFFPLDDFQRLPNCIDIVVQARPNQPQVCQLKPICGAWDWLPGWIWLAKLVLTLYRTSSLLQNSLCTKLMG